MKLRTRLASNQSKSFIKHKKSQAYIFLLLIVVSLCLFIFILSKITYLKVFAIDNILVNGASPHINEEFKNISKTILKGDYFGLFSRSNIFIYPHDKIVEVLSTTSPKVQSLTVKKSGLRTLKIDIVEKVPAALVCAKLPDILEFEQWNNNFKDCYLVDSFGLIFDLTIASSTIPENLYFMPNITEHVLASNLIINTFVGPTSWFKELQDFYKETTIAGLNPHYILVKTDGEFEMYASNTIIYFNNKRPLQDQLSNLISFWNYMSKKDNNQKTDFEYIDIRYGPNVFYR